MRHALFIFVLALAGCGDKAEESGTPVADRYNQSWSEYARTQCAAADDICEAKRFDEFKEDLRRHYKLGYHLSPITKTSCEPNEWTCEKYRQAERAYPK